MYDLRQPLAYRRAAGSLDWASLRTDGTLRPSGSNQANQNVDVRINEVMVLLRNMPLQHRLAKKFEERLEKRKCGTYHMLVTTHQRKSLK